MGEIPDHLATNLRVLFVGYNPGKTSALVGHHYAGPGNQFWRLLADAGITERRYAPEEDLLLLQSGFGFTNLVARWSPGSSDLTPAEMTAGAARLREKVVRCRPRLICFLGKEVYRRYAGLKTNTAIAYGPARPPAQVPGTAEFVAPNPSGRSTVPYAEKLAAFRALKVCLNEIP